MVNLKAANAKLSGAPPEEILAWASATFGDLAMTSSFQTQSMPLLHIISKVTPGVPVLFLETGYHFPETLSFRDQVVDRLGLNLRVLRGDKSAEYAAQEGSRPLHGTDPDTCCHINKVAPLNAALASYAAWITGIRRDQSDDRSDAKVIEDAGDIVRVHPMVDWTRDDVEAYIDEHNLPRHPLSDEGYKSIGCQPCTRPPTGDDSRSGRWADSDKDECGLHTTLRSTGQIETGSADGDTTEEEDQ